MYGIKNGVLYKDKRRVFALGESYYPSFNPCKFPVPPEGDRIGEMKKDIRMMAEMGFNHIRFAALGKVELNENGEVEVDTPFIDAMIEEADRNDISVSVRQQGFAVDLHGFENIEMLDWNGSRQETAWSDFIRTTMCHGGILEDNRTYAEALAKHYSRFDNMVAYQIYNEPHYPGKSMYDYHPDTVRAYRKWLVEKGILTESEAAVYQPPRGRKEQTPRMWALWRIFARDSLSSFLDNAARASKAGYGLPVYTCLTDDQISQRNVYRGCDFFGDAKTMDVVGYTCYLHAMGADYYPMCLEADLAQCAAELEGKESWCVELDSRTYIPIPIYNRGTYAIIGSGCKGIVYYQWRGDCPVPGVPHPNSCGLLNYDGSKTHNFDNGAKVNRYIIEMNDLIMNAKRSHDGVGLLHSDYASFLCDAVENGDRVKINDGLKNSYMVEYTEIYRRLREAGYNVSIIDAEHLDENLFGIKVLYVPHPNMLSPEESAAVDRFMASGGTVIENGYTYADTRGIGFRVYEKREKTYRERQFDQSHTVYDIAELTGVRPKARPLTDGLGVQVLSGNGYTLLVLVNMSTVKDNVMAEIDVAIPFSRATFRDMDGERPLNISEGRLRVEIGDGGIIILK